MGAQLGRSLAMSRQPTTPSGTRSCRGLGQACADHPLRRFLLSGEPPGRPFLERIELVMLYYHEFYAPLKKVFIRGRSAPTWRGSLQDLGDFVSEGGCV